nr:2Fe-2S iron-sulfur cluster-binding protein [bacterium]
MINLIINKKKISVKEGTTILEAAKENNIIIPHLCYCEGMHATGACRLCVVEIDGFRTLQPSCVTEAKEGMAIKTNSDKVRKARKVIFELMLSDHPKECLICSRNHVCEFQKLGEMLQVEEFRFEGEKSKNVIDASSVAIEL